MRTGAIAGQTAQEAIRRRYNRIAGWHDAVGLVTMTQRRSALAALDARPGERVLDLACGGGTNFGGILSRVGADGRLVGLDCAAKMLSHAGWRARRNRWSNVTLLIGDAGQLPVADSAFDRVICTYSLKIIPPYRQALDEVRRVLKPGGSLVVLDGKPSSGPTRAVNRLLRWLARTGFMTDLSRPLVDEIASRFDEVHVKEYDFGHTFVATARKG